MRLNSIKELYNGDVISVLNSLDFGVGIVVTSPPYNIEINYDCYNDNLSPDEYLNWTKSWIVPLFNIMNENPIFCLNIPLDTSRKGNRVPISTYLTLTALEAGFSYRNTIVWNEGNISKSCTRGSMDIANSPNIISRVEYIILFYKGEWDKDRVGEKNIEHSKFLELTDGKWLLEFSGSRNKNHPATFPKELHLRCLSMLSFKNELVLDPFVGSGTTLLAMNELGMKSIGIELSSVYCESTKERFKKEGLYKEV